MWKEKQLLKPDIIEKAQDSTLVARFLASCPFGFIIHHM